MEDVKIPFLNQKFVLSTFLAIIRKSFWVVLFVIIASLVLGYVYHRYTLPEYKTNAIIQIKAEDRANKVLNLNSGIMEGDIASAVELLRSNEFIKTVVEDLHLDVSYFNQGAILYSELYNNTPFRLQYRAINPKIYNHKINCEFVEPNNCLLKYQIGNENYEFLIEMEKWETVFGMDIFIVTDKNIAEAQENNQLFFIINDESTIIKNIITNLSIQKLSESAGTILITYVDNNANKSAKITNTIAEKFLEFDGNKKKESAQNVLAYIDQQMDQLLQNLSNTEEELHKFRMTNNILITDENIISNKNRLATSQISDLEVRVLNIDFEIAILDEIINNLKKGKEIKTYEILAMLNGQLSASSISELINSIQELISRRELLLFDITENTTKIKIIDEQIASRKKTVIDFILSSKERLNGEKKEYLKRVKELESQVFVNNDYDEIEFSRLNRLYNINENFYEQLMVAKAETMVSQAGYISNNIILERADVPLKPSYPNLTNVLLISFVISIVIASIYLFLRYVFYNKILTSADIVEYTKIPVLASIPKVNADMPVSSAIIHLRPKSVLTESFRNIKSKLEFYPVEGKCRVITVSSTVAGEGKTFIGLNIATIYAMSDKKTIILDFDLRKPRIHKCFDVENIKGISTILINKHKYEDCIHHSGIENLDYITSGPVPPNPAEIILNDSLKKLIIELKQIYDVIVIDTPPIGIVIDALTTYKISDSALYVMRSEVSTRNYIYNLNNIAVNNNFKNLSIVLNDVKQNTLKYGYGGAYGYGYGYGYTKNENSTYYDEDVDTTNILFGKIFKKIKK